MSSSHLPDRPVRFIVSPESVVIEDLSDHMAALHVVEDVVEAYRVARIHGYNVRYTFSTTPARPLWGVVR